MQIKELVEKIHLKSDCIVKSPEGLPKVSEGHKIPTDLQEFYALCGGMTLFEEQSYSLKIVSPQEFLLSNPVILPAEVIEMEKENGTYEEEISNYWYIVADLYNSDYLVIDLHPSRMGRCYRAFWDTYPSIGETPIIAHSFTDLLQRIFENNGEYWYFLRDDFTPLGDAYDEVE